MKLSVALCTYNGERFLKEQLDSIAAQTRPPDELVVCDDASADATAAMVRDFASRTCFPVRLYLNSQTLGSTRNFNKAIALCANEIIVLADQDDVWLPHKLDALASALDAKPDAGFAFSNAAMVDAALRPLGHKLWDAMRFGPRERNRFPRGKAFECLLRRYRVTGATMAFRADYRDRVLPIPVEWHHDAWIALAISATASCALVQEPLVLYRQHAGQQLGRPKRGLMDQYRVAKNTKLEAHDLEIRRYEALRARLEEIGGMADRRRELLLRKIRHLSHRAGLRRPGAWRLPRILREAAAGNYGRFSAGWKSIAQDLLLP